MKKLNFIVLIVGVLCLSTVSIAKEESHFVSTGTEGAKVLSDMPTTDNDPWAKGGTPGARDLSGHPGTQRNIKEGSAAYQQEEKKQMNK